MGKWGSEREWDKPVRVKGYTKLECLKRVRELEKKGWECTTPITQIVYDNHHRSSKNPKYYTPTYRTNIEYIAYMKRVEQNAE